MTGFFQSMIEHALNICVQLLALFTALPPLLSTTNLIYGLLKTRPLSIPPGLFINILGIPLLWFSLTVLSDVAVAGIF